MDTCSCLLVNYNGGTQAIKMLPMLARKKKQKLQIYKKRLGSCLETHCVFFPDQKRLSSRLVFYLVGW